MSEILVVTSKVKKLIKDAGMRTSADAIQALSEIVASKAQQAVENAKAAGKKTVQASDIS